MNIEELERVARRRGVDRLAIASVADVDRQLPADLRLSLISAQMTRVLVLARHMPKGVMWARHAGTKQYAAARSLKMLGEAAVHLAAAIEASGAQAMPLAPVAIDFGSRGAGELAPAGQGPLAARVAAVQAGHPIARAARGAARRQDRKSTRLNSSHVVTSRMPSSA